MVGRGPIAKMRSIGGPGGTLRRVIGSVRGPVDLIRIAIAVVFAVVFYGLIAIAVIAVGWNILTVWWRTDGPAGPHWGQTYVCTEYKTVRLDKFNGPEDECVAGYWQR